MPTETLQVVSGYYNVGDEIQVTTDDGVRLHRVVEIKSKTTVEVERVPTVEDKLDEALK